MSRFICIILCALLSAEAPFAAAKQLFSFGYHFNYSSVDLAKTDLDDKSVQNGYPLGLFGKIYQEDEWFARLSYSLPVKTEQTQTYFQTIEITNTSVVGAYKFRLSRNIKPYLGLSYEKYDFSTLNRYRLIDGTKDGNLKNIKGSISDFGLLISTSTQIFELPVDIGFSNGQKMTKFYLSFAFNSFF